MQLAEPILNRSRLFPLSSAPLNDEAEMNLEEAIQYALESEGSGFRRKLVVAVGRMAGLSEDSREELAGAIEYFHHASLIFDDLPAMDDAGERRGRPCLHRVAGEGLSILAALSLINRAYTQCWRVAAEYPVWAKEAARLVDLCIGEMGLLDGQARDLAYSRTKGENEVREIAGLKTGTLLKLTLLLPATLAGVSAHERLLLSHLAEFWGFAYQAIDDFADLALGTTVQDKTGFRDVELDRPNLVLSIGTTAAAEEIRRSLRMAEKQIEDLGGRWAGLREFHAVLCRKESAAHAALEAA